MKQEVYKIKPTTADDRKNRIIQEFHNLRRKLELLENVKFSFRRRINYCIQREEPYI